LIQTDYHSPRVRLGYACINLTLGPKCRTSHTCRITNVTRDRLEALARQNLLGLSEILHWNVANDIRLFRISSGIIPLASHPKAQWEWQDTLREEISRIGSYAKKHNLRLSMHPGQYTVLNSPHRKIVVAAQAELSYHACFLDALGLTLEHKIVLHVGGVYGDREGSLQRFREGFDALPSEVRNRLVLENDERNYNANEVLTFCESLRIPMVFDWLHHRAYGVRVSQDRLLDRVYSTWSTSDGRPKLHYSTQRQAARTGAHASMINAGEFKRFLRTLPRQDVDVMLEAKSKDKALLELRRTLLTQRSTQPLFLVS